MTVLGDECNDYIFKNSWHVCTMEKSLDDFANGGASDKISALKKNSKSNPSGPRAE